MRKYRIVYLQGRWCAEYKDRLFWHTLPLLDGDREHWSFLSRAGALQAVEQDEGAKHKWSNSGSYEYL